MRLEFIADIHGKINKLLEWIRKNEKGSQYLCVLGDAGLNFYLDEKDKVLKETLQHELDQINKKSHKKKKILFVRGNHECRPGNIKSYQKIETDIGKVYVEELFPDLIFLIDGEFYNIDDHSYFVFGGGFSADGFNRLLNGYKWFKDEQISEREFEEIQAYTEKNLHKKQLF